MNNILQSEKYFRHIMSNIHHIKNISNENLGRH
jgi:hypothetical protein